MSRTARIERATKESKVLVELDLDGTGRNQVSTGVGFYDHMLSSFARHSLVDLGVASEGVEHVVVEPHAGRHVGAAGAVEVDLDEDLGLLGRTLDAGGAVGAH